MAADVFPQTQWTLIVDGLKTEDRADVNNYIMATYAWPLKVYVKGSNVRWLGEPDEIVNGFFSDRLQRPKFLEDWHESGRRMRHWLMKGMRFYLQEQRREKRKNDRAAALPADDMMFDSGESPEHTMDRASAFAFVRQAMQLAAETCRDSPLEPHWDIFVRHHLHGRSFQAIAEETGLDPARAAVMSRTARRKFRDAIRTVLINDGASEEETDGEIQRLLEVMGS